MEYSLISQRVFYFSIDWRKFSLCIILWECSYYKFEKKDIVARFQNNLRIVQIIWDQPLNFPTIRDEEETQREKKKEINFLAILISTHALSSLFSFLENLARGVISQRLLLDELSFSLHFLGFLSFVLLSEVANCNRRDKTEKRNKVRVLR